MYTVLHSLWRAEGKAKCLTNSNEALHLNDC